MKINKILIALFVLLSSTVVTYGQVQGISGGKLTVPDAYPVEKGRFEFEPSISIFSTSSYFDSGWNKINAAGKSRTSQLDLRVTLGLMDGMELGSSFSTGMDEIFLGSKILLIQGSNVNLSLLAGASFTAGNFTPADSVKAPDSNSYSLGFVMSSVLSDKSSLDIYFTGSAVSGLAEYDKSFSYGASFGVFLSSRFLAIVELNGYTNFGSSVYSSKLSFIPGFTYKFSGNLLMVIGNQVDLIGKNELRGNTIFTSFTMSF